MGIDGKRELAQEADASRFGLSNPCNEADAALAARSRARCAAPSFKREACGSSLRPWVAFAALV